MRARIPVLATAAAILLVAPTPAVAGGWWTYIDVPDALGVGETVTAEARVMFPDTNTAEAAMDGGEFHAYLLRDIDGTMLDDAMSQPYQAGWWKPPGDRIWLAEVELSARSSNMLTATATFEVPNVPSGEYALMFCTAGCRDAMGDVVPRMQVRVLPDAATARMARDIAQLSARLTGETERVLSAVSEQRDHVLSASQGAIRAEAGLEDLERSVTTVERSLAALHTDVEAAVRQQRQGSPWTQHAGWFVAGLATAAALVAWRRRRSDMPGEPDLPPVPDDAGALVTGPPVPVSSIRR